jgi:hypothetical protein
MPKFLVNLDIEIEATDKSEASLIIQNTLGVVKDRDERIEGYWLGETTDSQDL